MIVYSLQNFLTGIKRLSLLLLLVETWSFNFYIYLFFIFLDLFEGDIVLDEAVRELLTKPQTNYLRSKRDTVADRIKLWQRGVVPYTIEESIGKIIHLSTVHNYIEIGRLFPPRSYTFACLGTEIFLRKRILSDKLSSDPKTSHT